MKQKVPVVTERQRPDVEKRRQEWIAEQFILDPEHLVFIDETCAKTNMTCKRFRSPKGTRLIGYAPYGHWKTTTFLAALRASGLTAPLVVDGPINGAIFLAYVQQ